MENVIKSSPTASQVHQNIPLTNLSIAYRQSQTEYIADKVFPMIPVSKVSNSYYVYNKNDWFRDEAQRRAPSTSSVAGGFSISTDTYNCDRYSIAKYIDDEIRRSADEGINVDRDATEYVTQLLLLKREIVFASTFLTTSVWGKDYTGVSSSPTTNQFLQWSDYANSNPVGDIKNGRLYIKSITGMRPNTLVLGEETFESLKDHPDIVDRYKYTSNNVVTTDMMAKLFEVDRVLVSGAVKATNIEGETAGYSFITGKSAFLCYSAPSPSLISPSAGYIFSYTGAGGYDMWIKSFRKEEIESDVIEGNIAFDCKKTGADLGVFFASAVA